MRKTRVLSGTIEPPEGSNDRVAANLDGILEVLDEASAFDPDVVCFPEVCLQHGWADDGLGIAEVALPVPGPETEAVGERARSLESYVLLPTYERRGDALYNAAALIGPDGDLVTTARKVAPTIGEIEEGVAPGSEVTTVDTEFGTLGVLICWDAEYPEVGSRLAADGADLVLFPSFGHAGHRFATWTRYYGFHVAYCHKYESKVIAPTGAILGGTSNRTDAIPGTDLDNGGRVDYSFAEINTDCATYSRWVCRHEIDEIQREYGDAVVVHRMGADGHVLLESISDAVTIEELEREFGLETMTAYVNRTRRRILDVQPDSPLSSLEDDR